MMVGTMFVSPKNEALSCCLNHIRHTETFRYGYNHRQDRDDGEDKGVGEGFGFVVEVLAGETAYDQHDRTDDDIRYVEQKPSNSVAVLRHMS